MKKLFKYSTVTPQKASKEKIRVKKNKKPGVRILPKMYATGYCTFAGTGTQSWVGLFSSRKHKVRKSGKAFQKERTA